MISQCQDRLSGHADINAMLRSYHVVILRYQLHVWRENDRMTTKLFLAWGGGRGGGTVGTKH